MEQQPEAYNYWMPGMLLGAVVALALFFFLLSRGKIQIADAPNNGYVMWAWLGPGAVIGGLLGVGVYLLLT